MKVGDCKHFKGCQHEFCGAGVALRAHVGGPDLGWGTRIPCLPSSPLIKDPSKVVPCEKFEPYLEADHARDEAEFNRHMELIGRGLSPCCEAQLDDSKVLTSGRYAGSGWVFCSGCRKAVMHIHGRGR